jgi:hypothetical protein
LVFVFFFPYALINVGNYAEAQVGKFKLDHAISIPMGTGDAALSPRLSVPITTSYIVRQTSIHPPDTMVTQGFVSLTTSALHAASASSIQTWCVPN